MNTGKVLAFRNEASKMGVGFEAMSRNAERLPKPYFWFDLNQGNMISASDPATVIKLVELARDFAPADSFGEHNALLELVARKVDLEASEDHVYWHRWDHVDSHKEPGKWISLKDWLITNGQNLYNVYRDRV